MNALTIERNGTGIERTGTGIERTGTGIERTGTGIERTGTGIERTGTGIGRVSVLLCAMAAAGMAGSALAGPGSALGAGEGLLADAPLIEGLGAELVLRNDAVALQVGDRSCELGGAGWSVSGYVTLPLSYRLDTQGTQALVQWEANGGSRVQGDGSGAKTPASPGCEKVFDHFVPDVKWATNGGSTHVWGEAEITLDGSNSAAVILYRWGANHSRQAVGVMDIPVRNQ